MYNWTTRVWNFILLGVHAFGDSKYWLTGSISTAPQGSFSWTSVNINAKASLRSGFWIIVYPMEQIKLPGSLQSLERRIQSSSASHYRFSGKSVVPLQSVEETFWRTRRLHAAFLCLRRFQFVSRPSHRFDYLWKSVLSVDPALNSEGWPSTTLHIYVCIMFALILSSVLNFYHRLKLIFLAVISMMSFCPHQKVMQNLDGYWRHGWFPILILYTGKVGSAGYYSYQYF